MPAAPTTPTTPAAPAAPPTGSLYRAVWRWHFYAGLLVLPWLMLLAGTGGLYLFHQAIDGWWHQDLKTVQPGTGADLPHQALVAAALATQPGQLFKYQPPASPDASAEVDIRTTSGAKVAVYVEPATGRVLGVLPDRGTLMWTVRKLHSLAYFGPVASGLIEIAAGWSLLLVATGLYLWWPRGQTGSVLSLRGRPRQRLFWRDLHAVTGVFTAGFIVFLAATGMPWSVLWGAQVNQWANGHNFGYPAGVRVAVPMSGEHLDHVAPTAWSLRQALLPESHGDMPAMLTLDQAIARFEALGISPGYAVNPPAGPTGVYSASVYPADLARQRVIHLDQATGQALIDMSYADYGPLGKGLEWGINVHLGQQFGAANQWVLLLACAAILLLCGSAGVMWWKRRPAGGLGVPPLPADLRQLRSVLAMLAVGGLVFPLVGASLLLIALIDTGVIRRQQADAALRRG
jgi:uncharacterized iron-regulated membrane protein